MPFFPSQDSRKIHYQIISKVLPQTTLFIHGNVASLRWWYPALDIWRQELGGGAGDAILVEFPGCGQSTALPAGVPVDLEAFAEEFLALLQFLKVKDINIVGHSTGAAIAALMLAQKAEVFQKAVFLDPVSPTGIRIPIGLRETYARMAFDEALLAKILKTAVYALSAESDLYRNVLVKDAMLAVKQGGFTVIEALGRLDVREKCQNIKHSTLVLHGEHDTTTTLPGSEAWLTLLENGKLEILRGVGHSPNVENPRDFVNHVNRFFAISQ